MLLWAQSKNKQQIGKTFAKFATVLHIACKLFDGLLYLCLCCWFYVCILFFRFRGLYYRKLIIVRLNNWAQSDPECYPFCFLGNSFLLRSIIDRDTCITSYLSIWISILVFFSVFGWIYKIQKYNFGLIRSLSFRI